MIDMRHEGDVQWDGFEYNWRFRRRGWRAEVGVLGSGGFVRRRMWVRLMMKPGNATKTQPHGDGKEDSSGTGSAVSSVHHLIMSGTSPFISPSTMNSPTNDPLNLEADEVWKGHDAVEDWERCHGLMRRLGRDGRKVELWRRWLGGQGRGKGKGNQAWKGKQWTEDDAPLSGEVVRREILAIAPNQIAPSLEHIKAVLETHVRGAFQPLNLCTRTVDTFCLAFRRAVHSYTCLCILNRGRNS